ncbi:MAG: sialate O-acetylesterase [Lentisphaerae bacterium]|jgi:sialate O-acetylesterase|nr:sialate O-acetylesterase [Lentisphaerota bacterium]MBT5610262.1 sialate O-acetylesterase [Lentisphaerota bacterium]MBT7059786.1 sialate O-acetylesterase [Lentisphaerota bacterium]MBT7842247.1 sialate O-acetylesterase [Lentisphaerota bacterium]
MKRISRACLVMAVCAAWSLRADVKPAALFADHMVLQRGQNLPVWGWADVGEKVTVSLAGQSGSATADAQGDWKIVLKPVTSSEALQMTIKGTNEIVIKDILMGEVWLCSGQSNMNMRVASCKDAAQVKAAADLPKIRHFQIRNTVCPEPTRNLAGTWTVCSPKTVAAYTGTGFFFGRSLFEELNVPIGIVHSSWGGTPAEAWTSKEDLGRSENLQPILERFQTALEQYPEKKKAWEEKVEAWKEKVAKQKAEGEKKLARKPRPPMNERHYQRPSGLYNGMILSLVPYAIKGATWYQGESNAGRGQQYEELLQTMIANWRRIWGQGDFPFYIVQIANFRSEQTDPNEQSAWAELRDSQTKVGYGYPNCGLATIIDIGDAKDIHPKNKQDVGARLAKIALAKLYDKGIVYSGPKYASMKTEGSTVRLSFDFLGGGLVSKGDKLGGFAVAGDDKVFKWADATIDGDTVVVKSADVPAPRAVRYGWANNPPCTLYNKAELPAVPFRTDTWPGVTDGKQ